MMICDNLHIIKNSPLCKLLQIVGIRVVAKQLPSRHFANFCELCKVIRPAGLPAGVPKYSRMPHLPLTEFVFVREFS